MQHLDFEKTHPKPDCLFFDADKNKYAITNEAACVSEFELTKIRKTCQEYNALWNAYQHGLRDAANGA